MENTIVILEHPMMMDRHVIAKVLVETRGSLSVVYWNSRSQAWSEDPRRRKKGFSVKVGDAQTMSETSLQLVAERLAAASALLEEQRLAAKTAYMATLKILPTLYQ